MNAVASLPDCWRCARVFVGSSCLRTMDSYTQVLDEPKRQAQKRLADLIMQTGKVGHA